MLAHLTKRYFSRKINRIGTDLDILKSSNIIRPSKLLLWLIKMFACVRKPGFITQVKKSDDEMLYFDVYRYGFCRRRAYRRPDDSSNSKQRNTG